MTFHLSQWRKSNKVVADTKGGNDALKNEQVSSPAVYALAKREFPQLQWLRHICSTVYYQRYVSFFDTTLLLLFFFFFFFLFHTEAHRLSRKTFLEKRGVSTTYNVMQWFRLDWVWFLSEVSGHVFSIANR